MSTTEENKVDGVNDQNEEWTVQTKPRRLVPQHALSKQDLEADKAKASAAASAPTAEIKKKGENTPMSAGFKSALVTCV